MNLKASRLNRCALDEGAEWYFTVTSFGHLRKRVMHWLDFKPYFAKYLLLTFYFPNAQEVEIKFIKDLIEPAHRLKKTKCFTYPFFIIRVLQNFSHPEWAWHSIDQPRLTTSRQSMSLTLQRREVFEVAHQQGSHPSCKDSRTFCHGT